MKKDSPPYVNVAKTRAEHEEPHADVGYNARASRQPDNTPRHVRAKLVCGNSCKARLQGNLRAQMYCKADRTGHIITTWSGGQVAYPGRIAEKDHKPGEHGSSFALIR